MAVTIGSLGGYQPICGDCGIALCWELSPSEYEEAKSFWDAWRCKKCNPNHAGALKRWKASLPSEQVHPKKPACPVSKLEDIGL